MTDRTILDDIAALPESQRDVVIAQITELLIAAMQIGYMTAWLQWRYGPRRR